MVSKFVASPFSLNHHPKNRNMIGTKMERRLHPQFFFLHHLNEFRTPTELIKIKMRMEIGRFLSALDIPKQIENDIYKDVKKYYDQIPIHTKYRAPRLLVPVVIYLTCLERYIFINRKELCTHLDCSYKEFNQGLRIVLFNNPDLQSKICQDEFRKIYIMNILSGMAIQLCFPQTFINMSHEYLHLYFARFKNKKNTVIAAYIFAMVKQYFGEIMEQFTAKVACDFLGIRSSVISNKKTVYAQPEYKYMNEE